mgnify:CR=1 FL=1
MDLHSHLSELPDFRRHNKNFRHKLSDVLFLSVCGILSGAEGFEEIEEYGIEKEDFLRDFLELPHGIPSHDTIRRVFMYTDSEAFNKGFMTWVNSNFGANLYVGCLMRHVQFDGKTMRGSGLKGNKKTHIVSAFAEGISLGQYKVDSKSNEIKAIPELLKMLHLQGCIVSIDAIGCQKAIATQIIDKEADYFLAVKGNQESLFSQVQDTFVKEGDEQCYTKADYAGSYNQVIEYQVEVTSNLKWVEVLEEWKNLKVLIKVQTNRITKDGVTECRYYISSKSDLSGKDAYFLARNHWGIENKLHWQLDVTFKEDANKTSMENAPQNLALLNKIALNILKMDNASKISKKAKRKKAGWSNAYLMQLLENANIIKKT